LRAAVRSRTRLSSSRKVTSRTPCKAFLQGVLDAPVPADGLDQDGGIIVAAREEGADLGLDLTGAGDAADRLRRQPRAQLGPATQGFAFPGGWAREDTPADQAAVTFVEGVEHRPPSGPAAEAGALEGLAHGLDGAAVVGLQHQERGGALGPDPLGDPLLAAHRIERHDAAVEPQHIEQLRIAAISFDWPSTSRWPSASPRPLAQALTRCSAGLTHKGLRSYALGGFGGVRLPRCSA
jgi:hypothetical protein